METKQQTRKRSKLKITFMYDKTSNIIEYDSFDRLESLDGRITTIILQRGNQQNGNKN